MNSSGRNLLVTLLCAGLLSAPSHAQQAKKPPKLKPTPPASAPATGSNEAEKPPEPMSSGTFDGLKLRSVVALTKAMEVEYLKPVPLGQTLIAEGHERRVRGRIHINVAEIRNQQGDVLARGRAVFIAIDPERMFARHLRQRRAKSA